MGPLSSELLILLDELAVALEHDRAQVARLSKQLEDRWRAERADDIAALEQLLATFRIAPQANELVNADNLVKSASKLGTRETRSLQAALGAEAVLPDDGTRSKAAVGTLYPVYFGTNRALVDANDSSRGFGAERSVAVHYGRSDVWIPAAHQFGGLGAPWRRRWRRWLRFDFRDDRVMLHDIQSLDRERFWSDVRGEIAQGRGEAHGLVFLHGFNVTFENAMRHAAQIGFDLEVGGATACFSWPSRGTLRGYPSDAASIEASESAITEFLIDFARLSGAAKVHVVAHSMGNRGLLRSLQRMASDASASSGVRFGQFFLAAPDVDAGLFRDLASLYPRFGERATLYASRKDKAVGASAWLHEAPRAGYFQPVTVAAGVDTVCVPNFQIDLLGHSYFSQAASLLHDMFDLMRHDTADATPGDRQRIEAEGNHWVMRG